MSAILNRNQGKGTTRVSKHFKYISRGSSDQRKQLKANSKVTSSSICFFNSYIQRPQRLPRYSKFCPVYSLLKQVLQDSAFISYGHYEGAIKAKKARLATTKLDWQRQGQKTAQSDREEGLNAKKTPRKARTPSEEQVTGPTIKAESSEFKNGIEGKQTDSSLEMHIGTRAGENKKPHKHGEDRNAFRQVPH
eukprot:1136239-Pelagomonas_calceolata.AAC.5